MLLLAKAIIQCRFNLAYAEISVSTFKPNQNELVISTKHNVWTNQRVIAVDLQDT
jgi:hypothetical protein